MKYLCVERWVWNEYFIFLFLHFHSLCLPLSLLSQDKFCSNSASVFFWSVLRTQPHPQSQPLTPIETDHRSHLPSSHDSLVLTSSQLNSRFSTVEISLTIQLYKAALITLLHSPSVLFFQPWLFFPPSFSHAICTAVWFFWNASASDVHFSSLSWFPH